MVDSRGQVDELVDLYEAGATLVELGERFGVHRRTAAAHLVRRSAPIRRRGLNDCHLAEAVELYSDDYTSVLYRGGPDLAAGVFADEPPRTGSAELDAAFAALADYLADRDGWPAPAWASAPSRRTAGWYPAVPAIFRDDADKESPEAFRRRGILITARSLARA